MTNEIYAEGVKAVIFDWAGTTVDYGCFAPVNALISAFQSNGIEISASEARTGMGTSKKDQIRMICGLERIKTLWKEKFNRKPSENDFSRLYEAFEPVLLKSLGDYSDPLPGVLELVKRLKEKNIKIGSTTGYSSNMIDIVACEAKKKGYAPDCIITPEDVPQGRPFPWMCYLNAIRLGIFPLETIVKVGDTAADIREGINAGMWSIGVVRGSSELGLSKDEVSSLDFKSQRNKRIAVYEKFKGEGAHYVIKEISDLGNVLEDIGRRLRKGEMPNARKCKFP